MPTLPTRVMAKVLAPFSALSLLLLLPLHPYRYAHTHLWHPCASDSRSYHYHTNTLPSDIYTVIQPPSVFKPPTGYSSSHCFPSAPPQNQTQYPFPQCPPRNLSVSKRSLITVPASVSKIRLASLHTVLHLLLLLPPSVANRDSVPIRRFYYGTHARRHKL